VVGDKTQLDKTSQTLLQFVKAFKTILELQGFPIAKASKEIREDLGSSEQEKRNMADQKRKAILEYHSANNSFYKNLLGDNSAAPWPNLPIITKKDLQRPIHEMLSDEFNERDVYIANTSGSSGHPFFFAKDKYSHALTWAYIFESYRNLGISPEHWQARFYGIPLDLISNVKEKIKDRFMHRVRFPVFDLGDAQLEIFLQRFRSRKIHYVYGYTNSILLFSKFVRASGIVVRNICPTLFACIVTSEVCTDEDKKTIESALGVPVYREYGASELDVIAIEDRAGRWSVNESNLFVEVVDDANRPLPIGEEGRIVVTSLTNKAMPFIRYEIGDVGILSRDEKGLVIKKLSGRINDTIVLPSGKKSPGLTFYYVSRSILESSGVLKEFIIRQTALDSFEFDVVADRALTEQETSEIRSKMVQYLEPGLKLKINRVEKISRPASGKIKHFYSEINK
jgi:phenylacetate-CoA ligase